MSKVNNGMTSFGEVLTQLNAGVIEDNLTVMLRETARHVATTQKKGQVALTLTISPVKDSDDMVSVASQVKFSRPTPTGSKGEDTTQTMNLFVDARGNLSVTPHEQVIAIKLGNGETVAATPETVRQ